MTLLDLQRPDWMELANCRGLDTNVFYPAETDGPTVQRAVQVCRGCDVQAECLAYALSIGEQWGIWGGLTEHQRQRLRRSRQRQRGAQTEHGTIAGFAQHHREGTPPAGTACGHTPWLSTTRAHRVLGWR